MFESHLRAKAHWKCRPGEAQRTEGRPQRGPVGRWTGREVPPEGSGGKSKGGPLAAIRCEGRSRLQCILNCPFSGLLSKGLIYSPMSVAFSP